MAIMTKRGTLDNQVTYEHYCDSLSDLANIDPEQINLGSVAIILEGSNGTLEVYMAKTDKTWVKLN